MSTFSTYYGNEQIDSNLVSRRRTERYAYRREAHWDFFTAATGARAGFVENISEGGCLLRAGEPIEIRRWLRIIVQDQAHRLWFSAVGRITRRKDEMEAWDSDRVTLYRYGVEFVSPVNTAVLNLVRETHQGCVTCGSSDASIPDVDQPDRLNCVLCHLRKACRDLTSLS